MKNLRHILARIERLESLLRLLLSKINGAPPPPAPAGTLQQIRIPFALANASSTALLPVGAFVKSCSVEIDTPYNVGATVSVGQTGTPSSFMPTTGNDPQVVGFYEQQQETPAVGGLPVLVTVTGAAAGSGVAWVTYATPLT